MATTTATDLACLDGVTTPAAEATIPVVDEGFIRGDGVFEVIRVYDGRPYKLAEHLDRLERSAANLRLGWDVPRAELEREAAELLEARGGADFHGALPLALPGGARRGALRRPPPPRPAARRTSPAAHRAGRPRTGGRPPRVLRHLRADAHP